MPAPTNRELDRQILSLAIPAVFALLADPLYDLTDTAILGHIGTSALAGAALAATLLTTGYAVFIFLMFGTTATVSRLLGAGDERGALHHAVQALWLGAGLGVAVAAVLWPISDRLIAIVGGRGAVAAAAGTYFRVSLAGFPALLIVMAGSGYLRGTRNTRTPLWIALATVALNLVVEVVLIFGLGFGVGASALGTVVAKSVAAVSYVVIVRSRARAGGVSLRPARDAMGSLSAAALPLFIRTAALRGALTIGTAVAGRLGEAQLAAYAIGFQIWMFLAYLADGLEVSGQALVGTFLGRSDPALARRVGVRILRSAVVLGIGGTIVVWALREVLPAVFVDDPVVRDLATMSLWWVAAMQPLNMVAFSLDGILVGAGDLNFLAVAMIVSLALFAPAALGVVWGGLGLGWLWAAVTLLMASRVALLGLRFRSSSWATI